MNMHDPKPINVSTNTPIGQESHQENRCQEIKEGREEIEIISQTEGRRKEKDR